MSLFDLTIAGEINLDLILYGLPTEMPLERELLASRFAATLGSSSAILAHNAASLGCTVGFITKVGSDALGPIALDRLREAGVDLTRVKFARDGEQTGVTILLHHGADRHILTYPGVMASMTIADLDVDYLASSRHFHLSSLYLQKALAPDVATLFRILKSRGLTISLDTNDDPEDRWGAPLDELLPLIDIFLPNEDEAKRIARTDDLNAALDYLAHRVSIVAIKCGRRGSIVRSGDQTWNVPGLAIETADLVDTIGAGDSFNAGFLHAYLRKLPLPECARSGNLTAALSTLRNGGTESFRDATFRKHFLSEHLPALDSRAERK
jgi:sugar/nucleoside kinase (ribokinase family)